MEVNVKVLKAKGLPNWRSMKECFYAAHNFTAKFILEFIFILNIGNNFKFGCILLPDPIMLERFGLQSVVLPD